MEPRANQSDSPATGAATFPAQHTTIGIGIRSSCCSFLATQTMVCSKMKDKIWQKVRDKKHFIRDEIYWWQRERTLMGHAHILWVLLSAARIAVRALNCITYHVAEPVGVHTRPRSVAAGNRHSHATLGIMGNHRKVVLYHSNVDFTATRGQRLKATTV